MNFEWEIADVEYGQNKQTFDKEFYKGKHEIVTALYRWLDQDAEFTVNNDNLGGDPAEGVHKKSSSATGVSSVEELITGQIGPIPTGICLVRAKGKRPPLERIGVI